MNILEIVDTLMAEGYTEEEASLFADDMFGYYGDEEPESGLKLSDLRVGSVLEDINGSRHTVIKFDGCFVVTTYGRGENWLVESHLASEKLIKY